MKVGARVNLFNARLVEERKKRNMSQADMAFVLGISLPHYCAIETLRVPIKDISYVETKLLEISEYLELPFDYLFPDDYLFALQKQLLPRRRNLVLFREHDLHLLPPTQESLQLPSPSEIVDKEIDAISLKNEMELAFKELPPREARLLRHRYGFYEGKAPLTLEEAANKFGITRERVRQIEAQALSRLRHPTIRRKLAEYK